MKRRVAILVAVAGMAVFGTAGARADGLPVLGVDVGSTGVVSPSGNARYVTMPAGQNTLLARVDPHGGRIVATNLLYGTFTIPAVAYDASAAGLAADGKTLVLIQPRAGFPRYRTELMVVDTRQLLARKLIDLRGDFSFDAVFPRGRLVYLIQYTSPTDPARYLVRAYDMRSLRLVSKPVVDPRVRGDEMRGSPATRATSPDGRWAYTLYDGAGGTPFVHALDTATGTARCIDLAALRGTNVSPLRLRLGRTARTLTIVNGRRPLLVVDTRTFAVGTPASPTSGIPWVLIGLSILTTAVAAGALILALRRRGAALTRPSRSPVRAS